MKKESGAAKTTGSSQNDQLTFVALVSVDDLTQKQRIPTVTVIGSSLRSNELYLALTGPFGRPLGQFKMDDGKCKMESFSPRRYSRMPCSSQIWKTMFRLPHQIDLRPSDLVALLKKQDPSGWSCTTQNRTKTCDSVKQGPEISQSLHAKIMNVDGKLPILEIQSETEGRAFQMVLKMTSYETEVQANGNSRDFEIPDKNQ